MAKYIARHAAAKQNHVARNATIAAAAGAVVLGSVAPANAYAHAGNSYSGTTQHASAHHAKQYKGQANNFSKFRSAHEGYAQQSSTSSSADTKNLSGARAKVVAAAYDGIGGSYVWGGKSYKAWDCSGFVSYVYKQAGVDLTAYTYAMKGEVKQTSNPQPGDIVFSNGYSHVGIYVGNGKMISALNPQQGTQLTTVDGGGFMKVDGYFTAL